MIIFINIRKGLGFYRNLMYQNHKTKTADLLKFWKSHVWSESIRFFMSWFKVFIGYQNYEK